MNNNQNDRDTPSTASSDGSAQNPGRRNWLKSGLAAMVGMPLLSKHSFAGESLAPASMPAPGPVISAGAANTPTKMGLLFEDIKKEASDEMLYKFLYAMPKGGDIHHHLGGGFLPYMWLMIATDPKRNGGQRFYTRYKITEYRPHPLLSRPGVSHIFQWINLSEDNYQKLSTSHKADFKPLDELNQQQQAEWMSAIVLDQDGEGRNEFFEYHWSRLGDMGSSIHVLSELLVENMKLFGAEGVTYLEIQRGAFGYLDANGDELAAEVADAFWKDRLAQPDALATGVTVRWQGIVIRFTPDAEMYVRKYYAHIDANRDQWVGINMAGREDDNRGFPRRFTAVYDEMLRKYPGIGISIHAGESEKPDSYIRDTLRLGATRIGHGINLLWDADTMLRMRDSKFLVEINLISNELLGYVPDLDLHPFPIYLRQGIPCCLNTDDRGMWDSNFTDEVFVAVKRFNLSWQELKQLGMNSYQHSFAEPNLKQQLLENYTQRLDGFEAEFSQSNWQSVTNQIPAITHGYGMKDLGLQLA